MLCYQALSSLTSDGFSQPYFSLLAHFGWLTYSLCFLQLLPPLPATLSPLNLSPSLSFAEIRTPVPYPPGPCLVIFSSPLGQTSSHFPSLHSMYKALTNHKAEKDMQGFITLPERFHLMFGFWCFECVYWFAVVEKWDFWILWLLQKLSFSLASDWFFFLSEAFPYKLQK